MDVDFESCSTETNQDRQVSPLSEKLSSNGSDFSEIDVHSITNSTIKSTSSESTDSGRGSSIDQDQETSRKYMKGEVFIDITERGSKQ